VLPESLRKIFTQALSTGKRVAAQIRLNHPGRGELSVHVNITPVQSNGEKNSGAIAVLNDFSCAEKIEQKLDRVDRLASIGTLSASMAHEIKNALVAVKTFTDLLLSRNSENELAGIVGREMTRIDSIVSQILTFSGPAKPVLSPIRLHEVLNHSLRLVQHQLGKKSIKLDRAFAAAPDVIKGDDYQLKQAFLNLFLNAIEAMPANGTLTISTTLIEAAAETTNTSREKNTTQLRVAIRDTGAGIAPENLGRVFEPFFTTKPKGTGLGLPITRRIVQTHLGTISVESQPNQGATFSIVFPAFRKGY
jgi:signal transduction histidine kinase